MLFMHNNSYFVIIAKYYVKLVKTAAQMEIGLKTIGVLVVHINPATLRFGLQRRDK